MAKKQKKGKRASTRRAELPRALAKRAAQLSATKRGRLSRRAGELIALITRRRAEISDAFYDIGEALTELRAKDMLSALGVRSFAELCESKLGFSVSLAQQLIEVVAKMTRDEAISMGQTKAIAMVALAEATPEADTAGALLAKGRVKLPGGGSVDTRTASARGIERAAKQIRDAHDKGKPRRGRTTTPEERALAAALQKALHAAGITAATVEAVATKPGRPSELRIAHLPVDRLAAVGRALANAARRAKRT